MPEKLRPCLRAWKRRWRISRVGNASSSSMTSRARMKAMWSARRAGDAGDDEFYDSRGARAGVRADEPRARGRPGAAADGGNNQEAHCTAFTVSVDARPGVTTGISAADAAAPARLLADTLPGRRTLCVRVISSRLSRATAGCCSAPVIPSPPSTFAGWRVCRRLG